MKLKQLQENAKHRIRSMIEKESGRPVETIEVVPDPENPGVYAARITFSGRDDWPIDLILNINDPDSIEEVEFETWPPKKAKSLNPFY